MIKLVAFDLDNTLARHDKGMTEHHKEMLRQLEAKGVRILIISGREISYVAGFVRHIELKEPLIAGDNGGVLRYGAGVPPERECIQPVNLETQRAFFDIRKEMEAVVGAACWIQPNRMQHSFFHRDQKGRAEILLAAQQLFEKKEYGRVLKMYQHFDCIDIMPKAVSKGNTLRYVMEDLGVEASQCAAVGDSVNDVSMLKEVGLPICIGKIEGVEGAVVKNLDEAVKKIHKNMDCYKLE